jgi:hypothetical protein
MRFDPGRVEQIAYFSQCRLLLERVDLFQNYCVLSFRKYRTENPTTDLKTVQNRRNRRLHLPAVQWWAVDRIEYYE